MNVQTIAPRALADEIQERRSVDLIDVRTPFEYAEIHVEGARLVPLDSLDAKKLVAERAANNGGPLYVICRSGSRAAKACEQLQAAGLHHVVSVEGGTLAWERSGLPVVHGRKVISLERQVRIAAGFLVVLGIALGWLIYPVFLVLSALVGAGLVFSGLTDTCGMGLLLARMPWNRVKGSRQACTR